MTIDLMLAEQREKRNASICAITMQASLYNVDSSIYVDVKLSKSKNLREICVSFLD